MLGDAVFELSGKVVYLSNRKNNYQWMQTRSSGALNALLESHNKYYCFILALFCHHPDGSFIYWKKRIGFDSCVQLKRQESLCHESNPGSLLPKASTLPERNQQCHNLAILQSSKGRSLSIKQLDPLPCWRWIIYKIDKIDSHQCQLTLLQALWASHSC